MYRNHSNNSTPFSCLFLLYVLFSSMIKEQKLRLNPTDAKIIIDIVDAFGASNTYDELAVILQRIFKQNITPHHYMELGHVIGYRLATEKVLTKIQTNNSIWQRFN